MYVYLVRTYTKPRMFKIGRSAYPYRRMQELQTGSPVPLILVGFIKAKSPMHSIELERQYHEKYRGSRRHGEWFQLSNSDYGKLENAFKDGMKDFEDQHRGESLNRTIDSEYKTVIERFA